ncbi:MAG: hypothetical protein WHS88_01720 [Anaerohalosphaeraceae bacterium]
MWTLIRREIEDMWVFYLVFLLLWGGAVLLLVSAAFRGTEEALRLKGGVVYPYPFLCVGLAVLGVSQMYFDRMRRLSAFLLGRGAVRRQVFAARVAAGLIPNLFFTAGLGTVSMILFRDFAFFNEAFRDDLISSLISGFLAGTACYGIGLAAGWMSSRVFPTLGTLGLVIILLSLLSIKGFDVQVQILFLTATVSAVLLGWEIYRTSSL